MTQIEKRIVIQEQLYQCLDKYKKNIALSCGDKKLLYSEIDRYSDALLYKMQEAGIKKRALVVLLLDSKIELILSILACLKGGYVFIPFDVCYTKKRLRDMLLTVNCSAIVTNNNNPDGLSELIKGLKEEVEIVIVNEKEYKNKMWKKSSYRSGEFSPEDSINVYYMAEDNGELKAVVGKNKNLQHYIDWEIETFGIDESFTVSQMTPTGQDAMLRDIFTALFSGGKVCIPTGADELLDMNRLASWIDRERVTLLHCTPKLFRALNNIDLVRYGFEHLKFVMMAGEFIDTKALCDWYVVFGDRIRCVNLYGMTGATMIKTYYIIHPEDVKRKKIPIGKPVKDTSVVILDEHLNICPNGVVGELYIKTPYHNFDYNHYDNQEMETDQKEYFIKDPFTPDQTTGELLYRTGDMARILEDGNLELCGKAERQVKVGRSWIDLDVIEHIVMEYGEIQDCAVISKKELGDNRDTAPIVAFYISKGRIQKSELIKYLKEQMVDGIIPAYYIRMKEFPLLKNGSKDYDMLNKYQLNKQNSKSLYLSGEEERVSELSREVLQLKDVDINQNLLQVGGNSLTLMTLVKRINMEFKVSIKLSEVFADATIQNITALIKKRAKTKKQCLITSTKEENNYPVNAMQNKIYTIWESGKTKTPNHIMRGYWLIGELNIRRIEHIFGRIMRRHEILRSKFVVRKGSLRQVVEKSGKSSITHITVPEKYLSQYIRGAIKPFDLSSSPLIRVKLITVGIRKHILLVDMHEIIGDAGSITIIMDEFIRLYNGGTLSDVVLQYRDYLEWFNGYISTRSYRKEEQYWLNVYKTIPEPLAIQTDFTREDKSDGNSKIIRMRGKNSINRRIRELGKELMVTPNIIFLSSVYLFLYRVTGQEDIVLGTMTAGRNVTGSEAIVGPFLNTLALRNKIQHRLTFRDLILQMETAFLSAYESGNYTLDQLLDAIEVKIDKSRSSLYDIAYDFHKEGGTSIETGDIALIPCAIEGKHMSSDICFHIIEDNAGFEVLFEYRTDLYWEETIEKLAEQYSEVLEYALSKSGEKIGCLISDI